MVEDTEEKFILCGCYGHALQVSWFEKEPCVYVDMWYRGFPRYRWWYRIKWAIGMLRGDPGPNEVVLHRKQARELQETIGKFLEQMKDVPE